MNKKDKKEFDKKFNEEISQDKEYLDFDDFGLNNDLDFNDFEPLEENIEHETTKALVYLIGKKNRELLLIEQELYKRQKTDNELKEN